MAAVVLPFLVLVTLLAVGVVQARKNTDEPAFLRFQAWQLLVGLVVLLVSVAHMTLGSAVPTPHGSPLIKIVPVLLVLLLAVVLMLRKRRADGADF